MIGRRERASRRTCSTRRRGVPPPASRWRSRSAAARSGSWCGRRARTTTGVSAASLPPEPTPATYRIRFDTAAYFAASGVAGFYPEVAVVFEVTDGGDAPPRAAPAEPVRLLDLPGELTWACGSDRTGTASPASTSPRSCGTVTATTSPSGSSRCDSSATSTRCTWRATTRRCSPPTPWPAPCTRSPTSNRTRRSRRSPSATRATCSRPHRLPPRPRSGSSSTRGTGSRSTEGRIRTPSRARRTVAPRTRCATPRAPA